MKTKTIKLTIEVPTPEAIAVGLDAQADAGYVSAKARTVQARRELETAEQRVIDANRAVDRTRAAVSDGRAAPRDLERALADQKTAALSIERFREKVAEAQRQETRALEEANAAVRAEGEKRIRVLQAAAKAIAPVLDAIKAAEIALDANVPKLPAVEWPACTQDDAAFTPHNPLPPLTWR